MRRFFSCNTDATHTLSNAPYPHVSPRTQGLSTLVLKLVVWFCRPLVPPPRPAPSRAACCLLGGMLWDVH